MRRLEKEVSASRLAPDLAQGLLPKYYQTDDFWPTTGPMAIHQLTISTIKSPTKHTCKLEHFPMPAWSYFLFSSWIHFPTQFPTLGASLSRNSNVRTQVAFLKPKIVEKGISSSYTRLDDLDIKTSFKSVQPTWMLDTSSQYIRASFLDPAFREDQIHRNSQVRCLSLFISFLSWKRRNQSTDHHGLKANWSVDYHVIEFPAPIILLNKQNDQ